MNVSKLSPFARRHIGISPQDLEHILSTLNVSSLEDLTKRAIPGQILDHTLLQFDSHLGGEQATEASVLEELRSIAQENVVAKSFIGQGYYGTFTPGVIQRNILENPAWYTAYTPYQPEISQGRLEALLNFQTMIADLTGLPVAGSSLLDEATAAAEAMALLYRGSKNKGNTLLVDTDIFPQTLDVLYTRAAPLGITIEQADLSLDWPSGEYFGVITQYPGNSGGINDIDSYITQAHQAGALIAIGADVLALTLATPPGQLGDTGADVCFGTTQRFGVPMGFGGPHAGYISVKEQFARQLPGRLVGISRDADGAVAYRLALQTREQHIRRDRATSNICTAQVLLAIMAAMYASYHGSTGLKNIALRVHHKALALASGLEQAGLSVVNPYFFDTVCVHVPGKAWDIATAGSEQGINLRIIDDSHLGISCDETTTDHDLVAVAALFSATIRPEQDSPHSHRLRFVRTSDFLQYPAFEQYQTETTMLRYLRRLADKDLALDRTMIPLGSCTMKLNATVEMIPITWPEFAHIHPFAPANQTQGYRKLIAQVENWLATITGYDAVSVQPNAGSQGEYAGLLAIARYHQSRGEAHRTVCLIPSSAHGTNAASAAMVGMKVAVVACRDNGDVDTADLKEKIAQYGDSIAAIMITYPSTHGIYEHEIAEICGAVHEAGGQVYIDGANLNALVGLARPGVFGGDVSHLNLHKTFCIPHGGGGPGVGPVAVKEHLTPFLPGHIQADHSAPGINNSGAVSAAPYGSASILPITWVYLKLMGGAGLREATSIAIASANYIAHRLDPYYPVLYRGESGFVAHECIIDIRKITRETGVSIDDIAKRLCDYGFHAPTMSFPVAGTLMIEPTESENLTEIDQFCAAMISIAQEINHIREGLWSAADSPLRHAPHTAACLTRDWDHPYTREQAAYPAGYDFRPKVWPAVRRIDGAYGDRNLMCSCPPVVSE